ncbi:MAG: glutamate synthase, partial [Anaerolineae bacterium]|nr:glutamate synthase [Anaerolineae bacterium]
QGMRAAVASNANFWVAHLMVPNHMRGDGEHAILAQISRRICDAGLDILIERPGQVESYVLGRNAEKNEPLFWQIAGVNGRVSLDRLENTIYRLQTSIEREFGVHFPSFSSRSVVYKVQGTVEILRRYYPEIRDPAYASSVTLGHARYSTNTNPVFERAQPFNVLGHNGEFNTISRFRLEANMLGIDLNPGNSDSQDVDGVIDALCMEYGLDLIEAMEYVFPPFRHDLIQTDPEIHAMYDDIRRAFGPFAQGPAALATRVGNQCVFSVDALGLRPLWFGDTEKEYFATSERGVYPLDMMSSDPKPLAPGEKVAVTINPGRDIEVMDYPAIQRHVYRKWRARVGSSGKNHQPVVNTWAGSESVYSRQPTNGGIGGQPLPSGGGAAVAEAIAEQPVAVATRPLPWQAVATAMNTTSMAALGWERYHLSVVETMAETNKEQVGSLGWDGPLAAFSHTRVNLADYFKETVAVVTNPAIDRERERAQFSSTVILGVRPEIGVAAEDLFVQLEIPLLLGGHPDLGAAEDMRNVAARQGTKTLEDLVETFGSRLIFLSTSAAVGEDIPSALERIQTDAVAAVMDGVACIVLDDTDVYTGDRLWIDPLLVVSSVDRALREAGYLPNLRRQVGIVLRSAAIRDLHDVVLALGLGANALVPYALYAVGLGIAPRAPREPLSSEEVIKRLNNTVSALVNGIQKVASTIGCHEVRGYGQSFSSVGLAPSVADVFGTANYFGSEERGTTWVNLAADAEDRAAELRGEVKNKMENPDRLYPKMWKKIEDIALGEMSLDEYTEHMLKLEGDMPVAPRHLIGLKTFESGIDPADVRIDIGGHDMPVLIGAMSFGSQGELAYKAYAESAARLNILCVNGEGGELPDVMGKYRANRGNQIASARFGVNIEFLNSCAVLEIKIGQGAKPGEGGQLPGYKVTEQVALARRTTPGVDLISPSNNHDLYSIEDLAQLIDELKTANPNA